MAYVIRRLLLTIPILFIVSVMVFSLIHLIPGDPADVILGPEAPESAKQGLREDLGLGEPLPVQYVEWLGGALQGDLGVSVVDGLPVSELILERLPATVQLAIGAFVVSFSISLVAGIVSAARRGTWADYLATGFALGGVSIPHFWLGLMLILVFAVWLGWLPASGYTPLLDDPVANLTAMILPAFATGIRDSGELTRMLRSSLIEELGSDYIRTALSKGLSARAAVLKHAARNALIPFVTASGIQVAGLLGGLVVTETVFQIPGLGRLVVESILNRDYPAVQGSVLVIVVTVILVNLLVDLLYAALDPRTRLN